MDEPYEVKINGTKYTVEFVHDGIHVNDRMIVTREGHSFEDINARGDLEKLVAVCLALNKKNIPYNPA